MVLGAIGSLPGVEHLGDATIPALVDTYAPLGPKKQFFFLHVDRSPELDEHDLPHDRSLQEGDTDALLDDLGDYLRTIGMPEGAVAAADRHELLNRIVTYFYELLQREVALLDGERLVEQLIKRHEAAIQNSTLRGLTIPTRLACFSTVPEMISTLREEMPRLAKTNLASRFLTEYVAAKPPSGTGELSLAAYDRLIAISHHIINFGFSSDLLRLGLATTELAILPSGRLGVERDAFHGALGSYLDAQSSHTMSRSTRDFENHWRRRGGGNAGGTLVELEAGTTAEFGASLQEFFDLMIAAVEIPRLAGRSVAIMPRAAVVERLGGSLEWPAEKVDRMIEQLTLSARTDFMVPAAPFTRRDVYPWKFSRSLSYLRRPFILVSRGGVPTLIWGFRHMFQAAGYLGAICANGRLIARTPEMKAVISRFNDRRGKQFNDTVAEVLEENEHLIVRKRVTTIGRSKLPNDLGDIDVLVVDARAHRIRAIECKDLALARTPDELAHQLEALFEHDDHDQPRAVKRHRRRVEWLREHSRELAEEFNLAKHERRFEGMFVVDEPLFVPHLRDIGMEVVALETLRTIE
jgi:hypothetical protein